MSEMTKRDRLIPWYFVMAFVAVAIVNVAMVTVAIRTNTGLVTEHPYEKGLAYNKVIEAEEAQEKLGWKGDIEYAGGKLVFTLRDKENKKIIADKITATITRPTQAGMDFTADLTGGTAKVKFPAQGLWEVRIDAQTGENYNGQHYQQSKRIVVQ